MGWDTTQERESHRLAARRRQCRHRDNFAMSSGEVLELLRFGFLPPPPSEAEPQGRAAREGEVFRRRLSLRATEELLAWPLCCQRLVEDGYAASFDMQLFIS
ncbi:hypothetical protein TIFTF001_033811 [Ficus carica]|uniref:Uncharacterized protein n=1 Tax=Ficus carica TaxID=3494 RepID=A0AA88J8C3_FICCA|nr:hypothetical protein TIFTF001_033811 [Ficus carica]